MTMDGCCWLVGCWLVGWMLAGWDSRAHTASLARTPRTRSRFHCSRSHSMTFRFPRSPFAALTINEIIGSRVALKVLPWSSTIYIYFFSFANASPTQSKVSVASSWDQGNFATASRHLLRYRRCHRQTVTWLALKLSRQRLWCKQETRGVLQVWQATSYATCAWSRTMSR